ncbi:nitroreductase/quinone reductase family protein [Pseudonocardia xinjiangensis]|uniref:nitroreductase/quinone reductase family protein n=1 Tax=Pseudonocardia xinjiangensis TaxID=75289 RepID=UPI003D91B747
MRHVGTQTCRTRRDEERQHRGSAAADRLGTETFAVVARVLSGAERDEYYAKQSAVQRQFADYQRNTRRVIPVIEL